MRKIEHHVAQENHVEALRLNGSGAQRLAWRKLHIFVELGFHHPVLADMIEVAHQKSRRQSAIHLDAVIAAGVRALHHLGADVGAFNADDSSPTAAENARACIMASE